MSLHILGECMGADAMLRFKPKVVSGAIMFVNLKICLAELCACDLFVSCKGSATPVIYIAVSRAGKTVPGTLFLEVVDCLTHHRPSQQSLS